MTAYPKLIYFYRTDVRWRYRDLSYRDNDKFAIYRAALDLKGNNIF